jgi:hypothetical protein
MKKLLIACIAALSLSASAQSFLIMENGIVITTDKAGFAYDFGHYAYPQKITLKGGQYFVEENSILATIDENGLLYRKYEYIPENIIGKGINYFLSSEGELYTIDNKGVVRIFEEESLKKAVHFGGNYFAVVTDEEKKLANVYTVNKAGQHVQAKMDDFKISDVVAFGGTYFMNNRGVVHTITNDGLITPRTDMRVGIMVKKGGNYFTDSNGYLYTVAEDGSIRVPALPASLNLSKITKLGSNYFLDLSGRLFVVDHEGNVFERVMRDHDFRHARVISL